MKTNDSLIRLLPLAVAFLMATPLQSGAAESLLDRYLFGGESNACDAGCDGNGEQACDALGCDGEGCDALGCGGKSGGLCAGFFSDGCMFKMSEECTSCLDPWLPRYNGPLPFMKSAAEARGVKLPGPIGAGYVITNLEREVSVTDIRLSVNGNPEQSLERFSVDDFLSKSVNQIYRGDIWLLPCLNVYGVVGQTRTRADLALNTERFPLPISPPRSIPISVKLDGLTYGGGMTAAIGTKKVFASLDTNYTYTDFNQLASELSALVIAPRFGMVIDRKWYKGEVHIGAMYQDTAQTIEVEINQPLIGKIDVSIDQIEPDPWNFLVGTLWAIDERIHAVVELGTGGRRYVITGVTMRF